MLEISLQHLLLQGIATLKLVLIYLNSIPTKFIIEHMPGIHFLRVLGTKRDLNYLKLSRQKKCLFSPLLFLFKVVGSKTGLAFLRNTRMDGFIIQTLAGVLSRQQFKAVYGFGFAITVGLGQTNLHGLIFIKTILLVGFTFYSGKTDHLSCLTICLVISCRSANNITHPVSYSLHNFSINRALLYWLSSIPISTSEGKVRREPKRKKP